MQKRAVNMLNRFFLLVTFCLLISGLARADVITLHPAGGEVVTGEMLTPDEKGVVIKRADGSYSDPIPWAKLPQEDLREILQQNQKAFPFIEPFIEVPKDEKLKRTEVELKPVPRLDRPANQSLLGAMFGSSLGLLALLIVYGGNIYAGYEISIFRAQPVGLVCGVSAVLPIIGPIIFLAMPTRLRHAETAAPVAVDAGLEAAIAAEEQHAPAEARHTKAQTQAQPQHPPASNLPPSKTFARGQFTFNRRFFETQVPGFFAVVRPEADKEMVLIFKSTRGTHSAQRISRVSPNEITITVAKGAASEDIILPFVEIQEVVLKHRDA